MKERKRGKKNYNRDFLGRFNSYQFFFYINI